MGGVAGQYFKQFGLVVAIAVLFSLLVATIGHADDGGLFSQAARLGTRTRGRACCCAAYLRKLQATMSSRKITMPFRSPATGSAREGKPQCRLSGSHRRVLPCLDIAEGDQAVLPTGLHSLSRRRLALRCSRWNCRQARRWSETRRQAPTIVAQADPQGDARRSRIGAGGRRHFEPDRHPRDSGAPPSSFALQHEDRAHPFAAARDPAGGVVQLVGNQIAGYPRLVRQ